MSKPLTTAASATADVSIPFDASLGCDNNTTGTQGSSSQLLPSAPPPFLAHPHPPSTPKAQPPASSQMLHVVDSNGGEQDMECDDRNNDLNGDDGAHTRGVRGTDPHRRRRGGGGGSSGSGSGGSDEAHHDDGNAHHNDGNDHHHDDQVEVEDPILRLAMAQREQLEQRRRRRLPGMEEPQFSTTARPSSSSDVADSLRIAPRPSTRFRSASSSSTSLGSAATSTTPLHFLHCGSCTALVSVPHYTSLVVQCHVCRSLQITGSRLNTTNGTGGGSATTTGNGGGLGDHHPEGGGPNTKTTGTSERRGVWTGRRDSRAEI